MVKDNTNTGEEDEKSSRKKSFMGIFKRKDEKSSSPSPTNQTTTSSSSHESVSNITPLTNLANFVKETMPQDEEEINRKFLEAVVSFYIQNDDD